MLVLVIENEDFFKVKFKFEYFSEGYRMVSFATLFGKQPCAMAVLSMRFT